MDTPEPFIYCAQFDEEPTAAELADEAAQGDLFAAVVEAHEALTDDEINVMRARYTSTYMERS